MTGQGEFRGSVGAALAALGVLLLLGVTASDAVTLTDGGSTVNIDPTSQAGIMDWITGDGIDQIAQEWFWFSTGTGQAQTPEKSIDALDTLANPVVVTPVGTNEVTLTYLSPGAFQIAVNLILTGNTPGTPDTLEENITITNLGNSLLDFHLFEYTDFDLNGTPGDHFGEFPNDNTVVQIDHPFFSETTTNNPFSHDIEDITGGSSILTALNDGSATPALAGNDTVGSLNPLPDPLPNIAWAFHWKQSIVTTQGNNSVLIEKTKMVTPEPGTAALSALGLLGLALLGRRR